jgi:soluble lytic murein transglycosylase
MNGQEDLDAFVEEIPVEETRHYVKRVLQSFNIYQLLYQQSAQATLPLSCVKG